MTSARHATGSALIPSAAATGADERPFEPALEPSVDVIIVNWNGGDRVVAAARSAKAFGARVVVVDNGSTDDSVDHLERETGVEVLRLGYNAGFATACNAGAATTSGDYIFLLNPDARIDRGSKSDIIDAFLSRPRIGVVGPRTLDAGGNPETSVRRFPTLSSLALYQLKLHPWARHFRPLRTYLMVGFDDSRVAVVDQVIGAALIVRRSVWESVGGMDPKFFLLFEEVDLCKRLADRGYEALHWPRLVVRHEGHASFRRISHVRLQRIWNRSLIRYARKHLGARSAMALIALMPASLIMSAILDLVRAPLGRRPRSR